MYIYLPSFLIYYKLINNYQNTSHLNTIHAIHKVPVAAQNPHTVVYNLDRYHRENRVKKLNTEQLMPNSTGDQIILSFLLFSFHFAGTSDLIHSFGDTGMLPQSQLAFSETFVTLHS